MKKQEPISQETSERADRRVEKQESISPKKGATYKNPANALSIGRIHSFEIL